MIKENTTRGLTEAPGVLVLVWGGVLGLASGAIYLNESVDKAIAVGIAWFVTASVGMWFASYASLALMGSIRSGISTPALSSALQYFDSYQSANLPANLIQAQRDYFGNHGFEWIGGQLMRWESKKSRQRIGAHGKMPMLNG